MKILFYLLAIVAGAFGLFALVRATEAALSGGGLNSVQFVIGIIGIILATLWVKRARAAK
ncbi:MAG TPA: hypothetical protein PLK77_02745 [Pyrinomonadaceae bacterium]|nr:hypothetical protein [Pyrinomonadaceae bacterium]